MCSHYERFPIKKKSGKMIYLKLENFVDLNAVKKKRCLSSNVNL